MNLHKIPPAEPPTLWMLGFGGGKGLPCGGQRFLDLEQGPVSLAWVDESAGFETRGVLHRLHHSVEAVRNKRPLEVAKDTSRCSFALPVFAFRDIATEVDLKP